VFGEFELRVNLALVAHLVLPHPTLQTYPDNDTRITDQMSNQLTVKIEQIERLITTVEKLSNNILNKCFIGSGVMFGQITGLIKSTKFQFIYNWRFRRWRTHASRLAALVIIILLDEVRNQCRLVSKVG